MKDAFVADVLLVVHALFILFVVGGQALFMAGHHLDWRWVRKRGLRWTHLGCVVFVVVQAWTWRICPLTVFENRFRLAAGQDPYDGSFIAHWVGRLIYVDFPRYVFLLIYSVFGVLVVLYARWNSQAVAGKGKA